MDDKLFLKGTNESECDIISSMLQDSIFHFTFHAFDQSKRCMRIMFNRFCWENSEIKQEKPCEDEHSLFRVHSCLYIYNVSNITYSLNALDTQQHGHFMNLLSMHAADKEISLLFSDHRHIYINVDEILVYLKDLHMKHPTIIKPSHDIAA